MAVYARDMEDKITNKVREIRDNEYPFLLRQMKKRPRRLFVIGEIPPDDQKFLCVIGSRTPSQYGEDVCRELILGLRGSPVVIVSGLAIGIDSLAHEYALKAGLKTIAFPGSGLRESVLYPRSGIGLAHRIVEAGGALISPFALDCASTRWTFPVRNALMAGISQAVLIIEGREDSGTLITAKCAADLNRDLLAVPGSIFSDLSRGPNSKLREGAIAVTSAEEVLEALGVERPANMALGFSSADKVEALEKAERRLLDHLSYPKMRDELTRELGIDISTLNALIGSLELVGAVMDQDGMIVKLWRQDSVK